MARIVPIEHAAAAIEQAVADMINEAFRSGKVEGAVEVGDTLAQTQRYRTGRAARSTAASGQSIVFEDPGEGGVGFFTPTSRTHLEQQADHRIRRDRPEALAHVTEAAGMRSAKGAYPGYLEKVHHKGQKAVSDVNARSPEVSAAAERRAAEKLAKQGLG